MPRNAGTMARVGVVLLVVAAAMVGCGPKPPCEVSPTQVDLAKDSCTKAQADLEGARQERSALEAELTRVRTEIAELETKPAELGARLEELKKGSGR